MGQNYSGSGCVWLEFLQERGGLIRSHLGAGGIVRIPPGVRTMSQSSFRSEQELSELL